MNNTSSRHPVSELIDPTPNPSFKKKYIGISIISVLMIVAGVMIVSDEGNAKLFAPVSEEIQPTKPTKEWVFTSDREMVSEFDINPYRASERFKKVNIKLDGVVGRIHPSGNRLLLAPRSSTRIYEIAVLSDPHTLMNLYVGSEIIVYGEFTEIFDNCLIVVKATKISKVK